MQRATQSRKGTALALALGYLLLLIPLLLHQHSARPDTAPGKAVAVQTGDHSDLAYQGTTAESCQLCQLQNQAFLAPVVLLALIQLWQHHDAAFALRARSARVLRPRRRQSRAPPLFS